MVVAAGMFALGSATSLRAIAAGARIRIRKVETLLMKGPTREKVLVMARVHTDQGIQGVGEAFPWRLQNAARTLRIPNLIRSVGEAIIGTNPLHINEFLMRFENSAPKAEAPSKLEWAAALAAIEIALWDITGQVAGFPIYGLLGGAVRQTIPLYANHGIFAGARSSQEKLDRAIEAKAQGFQMFKWDPFQQRQNPGRSVIQKELQEVALFRKRFGEDFPLAIDAHARFETPAALIAAKELEQFHPVFFEEPVAPENLAGYREVAKATTIPIASGERLPDMAETRALLDTKSVRFLQLEPGNFSGLLQTFRGCAIANAYGVQMAPHDWCGPVLTRATTHLCAAIPNLMRQEYPSTAREDHWENDLLDPPTVVKAGEILLPAGPGLGSKLNEKLLLSRRADL